MAPKFGLDDGSSSNFDATLVLATMLISQLHEGNPPEPPQATAHGEAADGTGSQGQQERCGVNVSEHPSDHTRIWSELSGSAARSGSGGGAEARQAPGERDLNANEQREIQRISTMHISKDTSARENVAVNPSLGHPVQKDHAKEAQERSETNAHSFSQRHPSNWVDADEDEDDDGDADGNELCVQSTPPYYEEQ